MIKNDKGITMVALVLTVIVMAVLAGVTISSGSKHLKEVELQDLVTNMLLIQAQVKIGIEEVNFKTANLDETNDSGTISNIKNENLIGKKLSDEAINTTEPNKKDIEDILTAEELEADWYYLEEQYLKDMGLNELTNINDENQYYMYRYWNEQTENGKDILKIQILYTGGYTDSKGDIYYRLTELEALQKS